MLRAQCVGALRLAHRIGNSNVTATASAAAVAVASGTVLVAIVVAARRGSYRDGGLSTGWLGQEKKKNRIHMAGRWCGSIKYNNTILSARRRNRFGRVRYAAAITIRESDAYIIFCFLRRLPDWPPPWWTLAILLIFYNLICKQKKKITSQRYLI